MADARAARTLVRGEACSIRFTRGLRSQFVRNQPVVPDEDRAKKLRCRAVRHLCFAGNERLNARSGGAASSAAE